MKIIELIKFKGMQKILEECNYDLADVKLYLARECKLKKGYDLSKYMVSFKDVMTTSTTNAKKSERMQEFLGKLGVLEYDN